MDGKAIQEWVGNALADHWLEMLVGLVLFVAGRWWGHKRARREWRAKQFLHRLMVSLNTTYRNEQGQTTLAIRTVLEKEVKEVFLNAVAVDKLLQAAAKTTEGNPVLSIPREDRWFLLNSVLNEVGEKFARGTIAKDMGLPTTSQRYLICLTNEREGLVRTHKIRAMLVRKDLLQDGTFEQELALESPSHATRLNTLEVMRKSYESDPSLFLEMEIAMQSEFASAVEGAVESPNEQTAV